MHRNYNTGISDSAVMFTGVEVEHTPAHGMPTLFVVGLHNVEKIESALGNCQHIFFGANHSFSPETAEDWNAWEDMIIHFLKKNYLCSLDVHLDYVEEFNEGGLNEYNNFIPQIRVPIPFIRLWNYNTMIKIDDRDFQSSNPGVWSHSLHTLMDRSKFTDWSQYNNDKIVST